MLAALFIRALIPDRIPGRWAPVTGPYGPATAETGFELSAIGIQPTENNPTAHYAKIVGKSYEVDGSDEQYLVLAMKHDSSQREFIFLFDVAKSRNILTSERDKSYGGDVVLTPIALLSWDDFIRLDSGDLRVTDIEPSGFPKGCNFLTDLMAWGTLRHKYYTTAPCYSKNAEISLNGNFTTKTGGLSSNLIIRIEKEEFWFDEFGTHGKNYPAIRTTTVLKEPNSVIADKTENSEKE